MTRVRSFILILATILTVGYPARSIAESLAPLRTESATTLPSGMAEAILGASYFNDLRFPAFTAAGALREQHLVTAPEFGFHVGAGSWAEIQASFDILTIDETTAEDDKNSKTATGDVRLFTKVCALREKGWRPGGGIRFGVKLPNASSSDRLGTDEMDFEVQLLASKDLGALSAHINVGFLILGNPGPALGAPNRSSHGQDDLIGYSAALLSRPLSVPNLGESTLRLAAEIAGLTISRFDNDRATARLGFQLQNGNLTAYSGASVGLITASEDFGVTLGVVYAFDLARFFDVEDLGTERK